MNPTSKIDVPPSRWDRLFAPSSCLAMITTVDVQRRVNAGAYGTCVRVCHDPVCIAFTVGTGKDTYNNVLATREFVVNVPSYDREILEKVRIVGLTFAPGVNELEKAGLTSIPSAVVGPPRIAECRSHFECRVEWVKEWLNRLMVVGRVVAASVDVDCVDASGYVIWDRLKPAHYCGAPYKNRFVAAYETVEVGIPYEGPEVEAFEKHVSGM